MKPFFSRGQVLVQVLVMSMILAILATVLMKVSMQQTRLVAKFHNRDRARGATNIAIMAVESAWQTGNAGPYLTARCVNFTWDATNDKVVCVPASGDCGCTCTVTLGGVVYPLVVATSVGSFGSGGPDTGCQLQSQFNY